MIAVMTLSAIELGRLYAGRMLAIGEVTVAHFFGGAALRLDGVQFAMVIRDMLYVRVDEASREQLIAMGAKPFVYRAAERERRIATYYSVPDILLEDPAALGECAAAAHRAAVVARRGKKAKR